MRRGRTAAAATVRVAVIAALIVAAAVPVPASATPGSDAAVRAARWLAARQHASGAFADGQTADYVAESIASLVAAGSARDSIDRALAYVRVNGEARARERAAYAARIVMGIVAAGGDPRRFGGVDYVAVLRGFYNPVTGFYDTGNLYANALAVLGVLAAGDQLPSNGLTPFRVNECRDGGFGHETGCADGVHADTTALAVCVLVAAGVPASEALRQRARASLASVGGPDGGFGEYAGRTANANSTGLALSAISALREDPSRAPWRRAGGDPLRALLSLQTSAGGFRFVRASPDADVYATVQAIPGATAVAYPVRPGGARAATTSRGGAGAAATAGASPARNGVGPAVGLPAASTLAPEASGGAGGGFADGDARLGAASGGEQPTTRSGSRTGPLAAATTAVVTMALLLVARMRRIGASP